MNQYLAVVPARSGSKGIPGKNQLLLDGTLDFIERLGWFERILVSTNDPVVAERATVRGCAVRLRPDEIAGSTTPIKPVFEDLVTSMEISPQAYLWLFYIPFVYREPADFQAVRARIDAEGPSSISSFVPALTHPYRCWGQDPKTGRMFKFCDSDKVSRQEFPAAWANHHYLYCIRAGALGLVNNNLLGPETTPVYLDPDKAGRLIELDEMADLVEWCHRYPDDYDAWWSSLPPARRIGPEPKG